MFIPKPGKANYTESKAYRTPWSIVFHAGDDGKVGGQVYQGRDFGAISPMSIPNLPTNQGSPLKLHCNM